MREHGSASSRIGGVDRRCDIIASLRKRRRQARCNECQTIYGRRKLPTKNNFQRIARSFHEKTSTIAAFSYRACWFPECHQLGSNIAKNCTARPNHSAPANCDTRGNKHVAGYPDLVANRDGGCDIGEGQIVDVMRSGAEVRPLRDDRMTANRDPIQAIIST